ncbi:cytochrome P450 [Dendryphion nanum]|uniref:Cytochrome P450 n=1 Tax=Dendryphion nanum TaxID=256645 RepID=A0A9P9ED29_9PLEO|nr:cytochrome P450 [Dendryphion nanum]
MAVSSAVVLGLGAVVLVWFAIVHFTRIKMDPREPPLIEPTIPLFGHIIGMLREGPLYFAKISAKTKSPIITLQMVTGRTYVVKSPIVAAQVQRASSTLSFAKLVIEVAPRMALMDVAGRNIMNGENGTKRSIGVMHDIIPPRLTPQNMEPEGTIQLQHFADFLNRMPKEGLQTDLFKMLTRQVTLASMHTFYGPENPMAMHPELVEDFWNWENGVVGIIVGILPQYTTRKTYVSLEKVVNGFVEYFQNNRIEKAATMINLRWKEHVAMGLNIEQQARLELGMCLGINVNAAITCFWAFNSICSRPSLLAEVREEIQNHALVDNNTISFRAIRDSCPLLNSIFRETMRITSPLSSARYVVEDTIIADTYLLRKDTVVQISGSLLHTDKEIWGPDAATFNPYRFLYTPSGTKSAPDGSGAIVNSKADQVHHAAYRSFGGGSSLCPGRHFAQMEILALTAAMLTGFELVPPEGQSEVKWNPKTNEKQFPLASLKPIRPLEVKVQRRKGWEDVEWVIKF